MKASAQLVVRHEVWKLMNGEWHPWTLGNRNTETSARAKAKALGTGFAYVRVTLERAAAPRQSQPEKR